MKRLKTFIFLAPCTPSTPVSLGCLHSSRVLPPVGQISQGSFLLWYLLPVAPLHTPPAPSTPYPFHSSRPCGSPTRLKPLGHTHQQGSYLWLFSRSGTSVYISPPVSVLSGISFCTCLNPQQDRSSVLLMLQFMVPGKQQMPNRHGLFILVH